MRRTPSSADRPGYRRFGTLLLLLLVAGLLLLWAMSALLQPQAGPATLRHDALPEPSASGASASRSKGAFLAVPSALTHRPADAQPQKLDVAGLKARGLDPLLNADLLRIFEQLLGHRPEDPAAELATRLPAASLPAARRLLEQYQRYRETLAELALQEPAGKTPADKLAGVLAARKVLQARYFTDEEIAGLFGEDNRYDAFTVERLRIETDGQRSSAQRQQAITELAERMLTPEQQLARTAAVLPLRINVQNNQIAEAGQRYAQRQNELGEAAAVRMAEVDRVQADWQQRLARLAAAAPEEQTQLRMTLFTPQEQRRLDGALALHQQRQAATP